MLWLIKHDDRKKTTHNYDNVHSLATLLGTLCWYRVGPPFAFRTALIFHGIDSTRCWNISQRFWSILTWYHHAVAADLSAAHPWCKFTVPPHPKSALLDWDLVTVEAVWVKWTHCHVQETSLIWFELCDMVHYPAGSSYQKMGTL